MSNDYSTDSTLSLAQARATLARIRRPDSGHRANGATLYAGPSAVDGSPILVILTGLVSASSNVKTGPMLMTYILRSDVAPLDVISSGLDESICGDCESRSRAAGGTGACYVAVFQGPRAVYDAWKRGCYPTLSQNEACEAIAARGVQGVGLRLGAYGDPASVPDAGAFWSPLVSAAAWHTGYTHAAHLPRGAGLRGICHASADSPEERDAFRADDWSTFRVESADEPAPRVRGEARCPASAEAGARVQCASCPIRCDGGGLSVVIRAHGATAKRHRAGERIG